MKCLLLLPLLLCLCRCGDFKFKITAPKHEGTVWKTKQVVHVEWDWEGDLPEDLTRIDIDLMMGPGEGQLMENISFGVPVQERSARWIVAGRLHTSGDYFIKITAPELKSKWAVKSDRFAISGKRAIVQGQNSAGSMQSLGTWCSIVIAGFLVMFW